jgi:hypothetical protein
MAHRDDRDRDLDLDRDRGRTDEDFAAEAIEDEHPAAPEQVDEGFETGYDQARDTPEEEQEPNFARGLAEPETEHRGRFSEGQEELPDTPEKEVERRFSEGIERSPTSE